MEELIRQVRGQKDRIVYLVGKDTVTVIKGTVTGYEIENISMEKYLKTRK